MCESTKTLKLCTCGGKLDKSKPYWTLARKTIRQNDFQPHVVGMYLPPLYEVDDRAKKGLWLKTQLNSNSCFDFIYEPFNEDKLIIHLGNYKIELVFSSSSKEWQIHNADYPFSPTVKRNVQAKGYVDL